MGGGEVGVGKLSSKCLFVFSSFFFNGAHKEQHIPAICAGDEEEEA